MRRVCVGALVAAWLWSAGAYAGEPAAPAEPPRLVWRAETRVKRAEGVFPDPSDPDRVLVATRLGLAETRDDGQSWTDIPNTGRAELGRIADLRFCAQDPRLAFLGSRELGVFRSEDGGRTWTNSGNAEKGLADNKVAKLVLYPGDLSRRTLYVTHGEGVGGLSKSVDGGKTWTVLAPKQFAEELVFQGTKAFAGGGALEEPDIWGVYRSIDGGRFWGELARDIRPISSLSSAASGDEPLFGLRGGRLMHAESGDRFGPEEPGQWVSLFAAPGSGKAGLWLYAYDPFKHGLIVSGDGFKTYRAENEGLYVDALVKSGASAAANANGSTIYVSVNGQLYVGRAVYPTGPIVSRAKADPGTLELPYYSYLSYMGGLRAQLQKLASARHAGRMAVGMQEKTKKLAAWSDGTPVAFRVAAKPGESGSPVKEVRLDLSPLQGPGSAVLLDDGQHGDGAAGDGIFGCVHALRPRAVALSEQNGGGLPGSIVLRATVTDEAGKSNTAALVFAAWPRREHVGFWDGEDNSWGRALAAEGDCELAAHEAEAHSGSRCLRAFSRGGAWSIGWGVDAWGDGGGAGRNLSAQDTLVLWIKTPQPETRDVKIQLMDMTDHWTGANRSKEAWLIKDGYVKSFSGAWQEVRIPMRRLAEGAAFFADKCGAILLGGDDPEGQAFLVDDVSFEVEGP